MISIFARPTLAKAVAMLKMSRPAISQRPAPRTTMNNLARTIRYSSLFAFVLLAASPPATAQFQPPGNVPGGQLPPAQAAAGQGVRIDRLENRVRELTGQIEQLQFQLQRMEQQLQKFQQDVDFRLQEGRPPTARPQGRPPRSGGLDQPQQVARPAPGALPPPEDDDDDDGAGRPGNQQLGGPAVIPAPGAVAARPRGGRNDAFDPNDNPAAPGAPRPLAGNPGPYVPSAPVRQLPGGPIGRDEPPIDDPNAPLDLSRPGAIRPARPNQQQAVLPGQGNPAANPAAAPNYPGVLPGVPGQQAGPGGQPAQIGAPVQPRDRYQVALAAMKEKRFDDAEQDFRSFLDQNPRSRNAADATFNLGRTFELRGRHREAAEQYLKVSQGFEKSGRAPESMLRLGLSLERLGAKEQACATWHEAGRKYPLAPGHVRTGLEQQIKRAQC